MNLVDKYVEQNHMKGLINYYLENIDNDKLKKKTKREILELNMYKYLNESSDFHDLSKDIKDYLVSIGFNKSLLDKDFINKIINKKISKKELLELLSEEEINNINFMIRDTKLTYLI